MRTNRLPPKGCRLADIITKPLPDSDCNKGTLSVDEIRARNVRKYRKRYAQGVNIWDGEPLKQPKKIDLVDDPTAVPVAETQRSLFTHPDIIPSESEALLGLMHSTAF